MLAAVHELLLKTVPTRHPPRKRSLQKQPAPKPSQRRRPPHSGQPRPAPQGRRKRLPTATNMTEDATSGQQLVRTCRYTKPGPSGFTKLSGDFLAWVPNPIGSGGSNDSFSGSGESLRSPPNGGHFSQSGPMRGRAWMIVVAEMSWRTSLSEPRITMPGEGSTVRSSSAVA
jgi:hypothetical protein